MNICRIEMHNKYVSQLYNVPFVAKILTMETVWRGIYKSQEEHNHSLITG